MSFYISGGELKHTEVDLPTDELFIYKNIFKSRNHTILEFLKCNERFLQIININDNYDYYLFVEFFKESKYINITESLNFDEKILLLTTIGWYDVLSIFILLNTGTIMHIKYFTDYTSTYKIVENHEIFKHAVSINCERVDRKSNIFNLYVNYQCYRRKYLCSNNNIEFIEEVDLHEPLYIIHPDAIDYIDMSIKTTFYVKSKKSTFFQYIITLSEDKIFSVIAYKITDCILEHTLINCITIEDVDDYSNVFEDVDQCILIIKKKKLYNVTFDYNNYLTFNLDKRDIELNNDVSSVIFPISQLTHKHKNMTKKSNK